MRWPELKPVWEGIAVSAPSGAFMLPAAPFLAGTEGPLEVAAIAFLSYEADVARYIERISAAQAAVLCASHSDSRTRPALEIYTRLTRLAVCARLRYGTSADAAAALETLLAPAG
jgi:hypothetical protein